MSFISPRPSLRSKGNKTHCFLAGPVIKCFVIPPNSKIYIKKLRTNRLLEAVWLTNLPRLQGAQQADHVRVESSSCCFPRKLVSFVPPRELVSIDPRHLALSLRTERYLS